MNKTEEPAAAVLPLVPWHPFHKHAISTILKYVTRRQTCFHGTIAWIPNPFLIPQSP